MDRLKTEQGEDVSRITALSDGLFAIVLTLLILQFEVPDIPSSQATTELPAWLSGLHVLFFSYILSFVVVGLYWVVHHNLFQHIVKHDRVLLYLNLLFLLSVSFLPFPTELLGTYGTRLTWALYALNLTIVGLLMTSVWWYAVTQDLITEEMHNRTAKLITLRGLIAPVVFLLSIAVSSVSLTLAYLTPLLIVPLQILWAWIHQLSSRPF